MKSVRLLCYCICGPDDAQRSIASLSFWYSIVACQQALRGVLAVEREKEGELATTYRSLEFDYLHRKSWCQINADWMTLVMTSLPLASGFQCLFTFALIFTSHWLAEIWQLSRRGATGELEVEFKFQRHSWKFSFLFLPHCQSALESLLPR